jgi:myo-inositol-1(or 4)-monophosphatase
MTEAQSNTTPVEVAVDAAKVAGSRLLELSQGDIAFKMKGSHDIQAEADLEAERIILAKIREHFPGHNILSEEAGEDQQDSDYTWSVDPMDGTINFERHIEEYCVSIALSKGDELLLGVIYQPALSKLFVAEKGKGAFLNDSPIHVSTNTELINCLGGMDMISSNLEARESNLRLLAELSPQVRHMRIFGSSALHMARLAQGQIDFYYKMQYNHWDYAAGTILVQEAGGIGTDKEGNPLTPNSKTILAANTSIHAQLLTILKKV